MPESRVASLTRSRSEMALAQVDDLICGSLNGSRMRSAAISRYANRAFVAGWNLNVGFSDGVDRSLNVLADGSFPYALPRIAFSEVPKEFTWPHVEIDGVLCVVPEETAISPESPCSVTKYLLGAACDLIERSIAGLNQNDFRTEFLSYWDIAAQNHGDGFTSLLRPTGPSREVFVWRQGRLQVVGEDKSSLRRWMSRRFGSSVGIDTRVDRGVLVWLPEPPLPAEYPKSGSDVLALARNSSGDTLELLNQILASVPSKIDVFLGAPTYNGTCFAAVTTFRPMQRGRRTRSLVDAGFRPGHVPAKILLPRYLSGRSSVARKRVQRADHSWVHGRDQDGHQEILKNCSIVVLGCGSLGGSVARLLARCGIGRLLLVDPQDLDWANVGRHTLGARAVGKNKGQALASELEEVYPHLVAVSWKPDRFGPSTTNLVEEIATYDLIVSTTGNWTAECFLNDVQRDLSKCSPIVYGWLEPHASAAHAVYIPRGEACLRCGLHDHGRPQLEVTDWPDNRANYQEPACGAVFSPYGPVELAWANALVAESAIDALIGEISTPIHRIWVGTRKRIVSAGGRWSQLWIDTIGDPGNGGFRLERPWDQLPNCPVCTRAAA